MAALACSSSMRRAVCVRFPRLRNIQHRTLASLKPQASLFAPLDTFQERHIGPDDAETGKMLSKLGYSSMDAFVAETVPSKIRIPTGVVDNAAIPSLSESQLHLRAKALAKDNKLFKSYIGMGYHNAVVPPVILRNVRFFMPTNSFEPDWPPGDGEPCMVHTVHSLPTRDRTRWVS